MRIPVAPYPCSICGSISVSDLGHSDRCAVGIHLFFTEGGEEDTGHVFFRLTGPWFPWMTFYKYTRINLCLQSLHVPT